MSDAISCRKCKHIRLDWSHFPFSIGSQYAWKCDKLKTKEETVLDPVYGRKIVEKPQRQLCVSARSKYGECGVEAKHWEPKNKKNFFVYLKRI